MPDGDYVRFMEQYTGKTYPPGDFLNLEGKPVGRHQGAVRYTLGQRRGLGLAMGERVYVCGKSMPDNTVTVGKESALYTKSLLAGEVNWIVREDFGRLQSGDCKNPLSSGGAEGGRIPSGRWDQSGWTSSSRRGQ